MIKSAKRTEVAEPFEMNLQLFADEAGSAPAESSTGAETSSSVDGDYLSGESAPSEQRRVEIDINKLDEVEEEPEIDPAPEKVVDDIPPGNATPEDNSKWAQMRRDAEKAKQLERELAERDKWVEETFGKTHGLHDWKSYQQAVAETQRQHAQQQAASFDQETAAVVQKMQDAGYDQLSIQLYTGQRALTKQNQELAQKLSMMENVTQQQTKQQQEADLRKQVDQRQKEDFAEVQDNYPEFKTVEEMAQTLGAETWSKICAKVKRGYSLLDAYETADKQAITQKKVEAAKQKTLNDLNSKKHLKTEGDGGTESASTTVLTPETLEMYMESGMTEKQARAFHKMLYR